MEAHAGAIRIPRPAKLRRRRFELLRSRLSARRRAVASRAHAAQANRRLPSSLPGSEHTHLLPPKAY